jgi:hypothetical protein
MTERIAGYVLIAAGFILALVSVNADALGIDLVPGFSPAQMFGILGGFMLFVAGVFVELHCRRAAQD